MKTETRENKETQKNEGTIEKVAQPPAPADQVFCPAESSPARTG
jgi:hypothetical protein